MTQYQALQPQPRNTTNEILINSHSTPHKPYESLQIKQNLHKPFLTARGLLFLNPKDYYIPCPFCHNRPTHDILHVINTCTYNPTNITRTKLKNEMIYKHEHITFPLSYNQVVNALGGLEWTANKLNQLYTSYVLTLL